jgi:hypothetical protein
VSLRTLIDTALLYHAATVRVKGCYSLGMDYIPSRLQAKREVEDEAIRLGEERRDLDERTTNNTQAVIDLLPRAADAGVPFDHVATMVGVTRQTLYRWQEIARRLNA